jgi:hypothetical protein
MEQFKISRALGLSFKAWFRNFIPFTLLAAVLYAPVLIWLAGIDPVADEEAFDALVTYPLYALTAMSTLVPPLLTYRVIQELNGTKVSMWTSMRFGVRGIVPAIIFAVVVQLAQLLPFAGMILSQIFTCVYFVVTPVAVAERLGPFAAFARSAELTRGRRWGIFGMLLLLGVMVVGLTMIWLIPSFQSASSVGDVQTSSIVFCSIFAGFHVLIGIAEAVSYALLRQDKDGMSHADLARIFD